MPYVTPFRWLLSSFLSDVLHDLPISQYNTVACPQGYSADACRSFLLLDCTNKEYNLFDPPAGQTCGQYMAVGGLR
jgi:hypothetical protein